MYQLIANLMSIPAQNANTTVSYIAGVLVLLFAVIIIDLFYRLIRSLVTKGKF